MEWFVIYVVLLVQPVLLLLLWCAWDTFRHRRRRETAPAVPLPSDETLTPLIAALQAQFFVAPETALREAATLVGGGDRWSPEGTPPTVDERALLFRSLLARLSVAERSDHESRVV